MRCDFCSKNSLLFAHDASVDGHYFPDGNEALCNCDPEIICVNCNAEVVRAIGFLLVPREDRLRCTVPPSSVVH